MNTNKSEQKIAALSAEERVDVARRRMVELLRRYHALEIMHSNNRHLVYGSRFPEQIGKSYAGTAFRVLQQASHGMELLRLCAMWDKLDYHKASIPTLLALIDAAPVRRILRKNALAKVCAREVVLDEVASEDPKRKRAEYSAHLRHEARLMSAAFANLVTVAATATSQVLENVRKFRDAEIAHNIEMADLQQPIHPPKYGDEDVLLTNTQDAIQTLKWLLDTNWYVLDSSYQQALAAGDALWNACSFSGICRADS